MRFCGGVPSTVFNALGTVRPLDRYARFMPGGAADPALVGRILPISLPIADALNQRRARRDAATTRARSSSTATASPSAAGARRGAPPVRLEFPILWLNPGLRQRCVAPDV